MLLQLYLYSKQLCHYTKQCNQMNRDLWPEPTWHPNINKQPVQLEIVQISHAHLHACMSIIIQWSINGCLRVSVNTWKVIETSIENEITSMVLANLHKYPFSMLFQCSFTQFSLYFQWKLNFQWYFLGRLCMGQYLLEENTESIIVFQLFKINWWNN